MAPRKHGGQPPRRRSSLVDMESAQSFPASDPPSYMGGNHVIGAPPGRVTPPPRTLGKKAAAKKIVRKKAAKAPAKKPAKKTKKKARK